jgi:septal ring factor EnvC (AmiA/AmiB activator)
MTFEEMQRAMEFVVQHQAQAEVNMARLEGNLTRLEGNLTRLEGNVTRLEATLRSHDTQIAQWMSKVQELLVLQSSRLDSAQEQHLQTLARLDHILEILARRK